ncbi:MAG: glycerol kinase GlpK [Pseudomonadota bacterium]
MAEHVLAIDQGTTSTRAVVFDAGGAMRGVTQQELTQHFPQSGWVEHDAEQIWCDVLATCKEALVNAGLVVTDIAAIGITNQRETTVVWEKATGRPIHRAIVWQDRRTAPLCRELAADGLEAHVRDRTGLVIDSYFAGTKLAWILDNVRGARAAAARGELAFGTIDCYLLWRLTGGRVHATDAGNASRTLLYDIVDGVWDETMLSRLQIDRSLLPEVKDNSGFFGETEPALVGGVLPVTGMAGDQQAATFGQACFEPGMIKSTYGTGCFALLNIGERPVPSENRLITTVAWQLDGQRTYAIEGSIFVAGAAVQWLRDKLGVVATAAATDAMAQTVDDSGGVYMVPAFTGLGAPHWDPDARGALLGLHRDVGLGHVVRATLEAVAYQTSDLMNAMVADADAAGISRATALRVDGGMVANDTVCQALADVLGVPVERPQVIETTVLGAAYLSGLAVGVYRSLDDVAAAWRCERRFEPTWSADRRAAALAGWHTAVARVKSERG